jgi:short-subunit dehydrogenase
LRQLCRHRHHGKQIKQKGIKKQMTDKVAVITGVSSGLGKAAAVKFMRHGVKVVGISRSKPDFEPDLWIEADITKPDGRGKALQQTMEKFGRADVLINNAGKGGYSTWEELPEQDLRDIFELNFFALNAMTVIFLPLLKESKGTVMNISSIAGDLYVPCMGAYCATKSAVTAFSNTIRPELKRYGIKVIDVAPGRIDTGFSSRSLGNRQPPHTPGGGCPDAFASALFKAWRQNRRSLIYPGWNRVAVPMLKLFPGLYDRLSIRIWNLDK